MMLVCLGEHVSYGLPTKMVSHTPTMTHAMCFIYVLQSLRDLRASRRLECIRYDECVWYGELDVFHFMGLCCKTEMIISRPLDRASFPTTIVSHLPTMIRAFQLLTASVSIPRFTTPVSKFANKNNDNMLRLNASINRIGPLLVLPVDSCRGLPAALIGLGMCCGGCLGM